MLCYVKISVSIRAIREIENLARNLEYCKIGLGLTVIEMSLLGCLFKEQKLVL